MSNLSGILGELRSEGVLRLYHDYRSGSLKDWSGNGNDGTSGGVWAKNGFHVKKSTASIIVADSASTRLTTGTLMLGADFEGIPAAANRPLIAKRDAISGVDYYFFIRDNYLALFDGANTRFLAAQTNGMKCLALNFGNGLTGSIYANGISKGNLDAASAVSVKGAVLYIANAAVDTGLFLNNIVRYALIISRPLTATEHQTLYQQLQQMSWPTKPYSRNMKPRYTEANNSGMQFRYSGAKRDGKYLDSSGNGNDATSSVSTSAGKHGIGMTAPTSVVTSPVTTATVPISASHSMSAFVSAAVRPAVVYGSIIGPNPGSLILRYGGISLVTGGTIRLYWYTGAAYRSASAAHNSKLPTHCAYSIDYASDIGFLYINGVYANQLTTIDIGLPGSPFNYALGDLGTSVDSCDGTIGDGTLWNRALTAADVRTEWLQYAQMTQWKSGWGVPESLANESTANTFLGQNNSPYEIISGTWKITTRTVDGRLCKCLECIAAGTAWLDRKILAINDAEAAYGSWAGRVYHAASATPTVLGLTSSAKAVPGSVDGHVVRIYNAESRLSRNAAGTYTDLATVAHTSGALVDVHAARRFDNVWQLYTKAIGEVWATAASAIDVNYTVSEGMSLSANAGDYLVLGSLTGNHSWTKYLGEFDPREI